MSDWFRGKIDEESEPQSNLLGDTYFLDGSPEVTRWWARWLDL